MFTFTKKELEILIEIDPSLSEKMTIEQLCAKIDINNDINNIIGC